MKILIAILSFGLIIFIHELGHFLMAKKFGVKVYEFSIGMGPKIAKIKRNGTTYSIGILPFGGYVQLKDSEVEEYLEENDEDSLPDDIGYVVDDEGNPVSKDITKVIEDDSKIKSDKKDSLSDKTPLQRIVILVAGGVMNIILGVVLCAILLLVQGGINTPVVHSFVEGATSNTSLKEGDRIVKIDDTKVKGIMDLIYALESVKSYTPDVIVIRDGEEVELKSVSFPISKIEGTNEKVIEYDFYMQREKLTPTIYIKGIYHYSTSLAKMVVRSFKNLFTGNVKVSQLSGPVGITNEISESLKLGWAPFLLIMATLTINLGIMNLIPFPMLDGGKIFIILIETITRRKVSIKAQAVIATIGAILLFGLMITVTKGDIKNFSREKGEVHENYKISNKKD